MLVFYPCDNWFLRRNFAAVALTKKQFVDNRQRGNKHYPDHNHFEMLGKIEIKLLEKKFLKIMAAYDHTEYPGHATNNIKEEKFLTVHLYNTRYYGDKRADDGKETGKSNGLPAMLIEKLPGAD